MLLVPVSVSSVVKSNDDHLAYSVAFANSTLYVVLPVVEVKTFPLRSKKFLPSPICLKSLFKIKSSLVGSDNDIDRANDVENNSLTILFPCPKIGPMTALPYTKLVGSELE